jgi:hypothetical protein
MKTIAVMTLAFLPLTLVNVSGISKYGRERPNSQLFSQYGRQIFSILITQQTGSCLSDCQLLSPSSSSSVGGYTYTFLEDAGMQGYLDS